MMHRQEAKHSITVKDSQTSLRHKQDHPLKVCMSLYMYAKCLTLLDIVWYRECIPKALSPFKTCWNCHGNWHYHKIKYTVIWIKPLNSAGSLQAADSSDRLLRTLCQGNVFVCQSCFSSNCTRKCAYRKRSFEALVLHFIQGKYCIVTKLYSERITIIILKNKQTKKPYFKIFFFFYSFLPYHFNMLRSSKGVF